MITPMDAQQILLYDHSGDMIVLVCPIYDAKEDNFSFT
jgi:hypothetical protein